MPKRETTPPNYGVIASVRPVTALASASAAPVGPRVPAGVS